MKLDDKLYEAFLKEMHALEAFRMSYASAHPSAPLDRDDPDVRRLTEALGFFSARTRTASLRQIEASRRRIFQQFVPYLLSPLPTMGMIQALPTSQFAEPVVLPEGSELLMSIPSGEGALCRTLWEMSVLPLSLGRVDTLLRAQGGYRLVMPLTAPYPRSDEIGELSLYINHLNDFLASLVVLHALKKHLARCSVVFDADLVDDSTRGTPCAVTFGAPERQTATAQAHPLEHERLFFHFPQCDLFMNIRLPSPPRNWRQVTLLLDLDPKWPRTMRLTRDVFQLFAVPVINLLQAPAAPLLYDGTRERCRIRHPAEDRRFALHSLRGVYRVDGEQMIPLRPGTLASGSGTYEIEQEPGGAAGTRHWLNVHLPEAFEQPVTLSLDAWWHQPWLSAALDQKLDIRPYKRTLAGLRWELVDEMVPHRQSGFAEEMDSFLHLFVLQNKSQMNLEDVRILLGTMGSVWSGAFGQLRDLLVDLRVEQVPLSSGGAAEALKLVYTVCFETVDESIQPLVDQFVLHVQRILDLWIADAAVEVLVEVKK